MAEASPLHDSTVNMLVIGVVGAISCVSVTTVAVAVAVYCGR